MLKNEGYDVDLLAQFFLEDPCSATPWVSSDMRVSTYTKAVKTDLDVFTFLNQLGQQSSAFLQAGFDVIDRLVETTLDLMKTAEDFNAMAWLCND